MVMSCKCTAFCVSWSARRVYAEHLLARPYCRSSPGAQVGTIAVKDRNCGAVPQFTAIRRALKRLEHAKKVSGSTNVLPNPTESGECAL